MIGVGHAEDGAEFNRLVGLDLSTQALRGKYMNVQFCRYFLIKGSTESDKAETVCKMMSPSNLR